MKRFALALVMLCAAREAPAQQPPRWTVTAPAELTLMYNHAAPVLVTVYTAPVTQVGISHSTLLESETGELLIPQRLKLCRTADNACAPVTDLAAGSHALFLVVSDGFTGKGDFKGVLHLQAAEVTQPTTMELTIHASSGNAWFRGTAMIALGVLISLLATVFLRQWSNRLDALAPAVVLRERLAGIASRILQSDPDIGGTMPRTQQRLTNLADQLTERWLDSKNFLPSKLASPFGGGEDADGYRAHLAAKGEEVSALAVIADQAIPELVKAWKATPQHKAIIDARERIDAIGGKAATAAAAATEIAAVLAQMDADLTPAGAAAQAGPPGAVPRPESTSIEIRSLQSRLALTAWSVWALITVAVGVASLIVGDKGFGTPLDYFKCFFWGLGIQAAGQQLQQLTPQAVATSFKLTLPK